MRLGGPSRHAPVQKLACTIHRYWHWIVNFFDRRGDRAINSIIQLAKRRVRGFGSFTYLRTIAYWNTGKLNIDLSAI